MLYIFLLKKAQNFIKQSNKIPPVMQLKIYTFSHRIRIIKKIYNNFTKKRKFIKIQLFNKLIQH